MNAALELSPPAERPGNPISAPDLQPDLPGMVDALPETPADDAADEREFDWFTDDSVLIREQMATAIYRNRIGAVVIRQEGGGYDEDQFVILRDAEAVKALIAALQRELKRGPQ